MGLVIAEISTSADGIVAGPDTSTEHRLGKDGDLLREWMFGGTGAFVLGRSMFDVGVDPWGVPRASGRCAGTPGAATAAAR
jgi:hypothetical protein